MVTYNPSLSTVFQRQVEIHQEVCEEIAKTEKAKKETIDDINKKALELGLSYGKYVALRDAGLLKAYENEHKGNG